MKKTRITISVLLSIVLVCATCLTAFADTTDPDLFKNHYPNVKQYKQVCCIGDSVGAGYSGAVVLQDNLNNSELADKTKQFIFKTADHAFGRLVAEDLGADYQSLTCVGLRCVDMLYMLDADGYKNYNMLQDITTLGIDVVRGVINQKKATSAAGKMTAIEKIKTSDLIIIQLGSNDAFTNPFMTIAFSLIKTPSKIIRALVDGAEVLIENYPKVIERIKELNPDATIVMLDQFNPYDGLVLEVGDLDIAFGKALSVSQGLLHAIYRNWAKKYGAVYVDVSGVTQFFETTAINDPDFEFTMFDTHYGPEGHIFVYNKIMQALPEAYQQIEAPEEGILSLSINSKDAGSYSFIPKEGGWAIKDVSSGKYVCFNNFMGIALRSDNPTIWKYDGGLYTHGFKLASSLDSPGIVNGNFYLSIDQENGKLLSTASKIKTALKKAV